MPEVIALLRECASQQLVEASPRRQALRQRQGPDDLAAAVEGDALGNVHAEALVERDADAREALEQLGVGDDAGAAADEVLAGMLEDVDVPAGASQQVGGEEPAQRAPSDQCAH